MIPLFVCSHWLFNCILRFAWLERLKAGYVGSVLTASCSTLAAKLSLTCQPTPSDPRPAQHKQASFSLCVVRASTPSPQRHHAEQAVKQQLMIKQKTRSPNHINLESNQLLIAIFTSNRNSSSTFDSRPVGTSLPGLQVYEASRHPSCPTVSIP